MWTPALACLAILLTLPQARITDFPGATFPVAAVTANLARLAPAGSMPHILTSDQWADYLIFRLYPRQRVFFDGRSDFYGPGIGGEYQTLQSLGRGWRESLDRYGFDLAVLPLNWPLGEVLEHERGWRVVYRDGVCVLLERVPEAVSHEESKVTPENCRTNTRG